MKEKTKKILVRTGIIVLLTFAVILVVSMFFLGHLVKVGYTNLAPTVTGAKTAEMKSCIIYPWCGYVSVDSFLLGNPEGFNSSHAIKFDRVKVKINVLSVFSDVIVIDEVLIDGGDITHEQGLPSSNLTTILNNVDAFAKQFDSKEEAKSHETPKEQTADPDKPAKKVCIRKVVLSNAKVAISLKGVGARAPIPMPTITLTNIGGDPDVNAEGVTWPDAVKEIMDSFVSGAMNIVTSAAANIGNAASEAAEGASDAIKSGAKDIKDTLGELF